MSDLEPVREPIFNVPGIVTAFLAAFIAVHVGLNLLDLENQTWAMISAAFIPARYSGDITDIPGGALAGLTSFVTHVFVHADVTHLGINAAWFLAFGSVLARRLGAWRFTAFTLSAGVAGALAFLFAHPGLAVPMVGASGAIAALMPATLRVLFPAIDMGVGYLLRDNPAAIPALSLRGAFSDRRMVLTTMIFVAINLLALVGFGAPAGVGAIAWEAHLGGYAFGLLAFGLFDIAVQNQPVLQVDDE